MIDTQTNRVISLKDRLGTDFGTARILISEPPAAHWRDEALKRLEKLVRLEPRWDGYKAEPVSMENAYFALQMLEAVCDPDGAVPDIVPGFDGDLQIEWHTLKGDIELHVIAPNNVHAWRSMAEQALEQELDLRTDFIEVAGWIRQITEHPVAATAAAA